MKHSARHQSGLSLFEVALVVATVVLLAFLVLPMLARSRARSSGVSCSSALRQVGLSYRLWSSDHNNQFPFNSTNAESSLTWANSPQVFRHFQVMSNELVTPIMLVCPKDLKRRPPNPNNGGILDFQNLSNANLSYFVGLDAHENDPKQILSGDRNITGGTLSNGFLRTLRPNTQAGWTSDIHHNAGNIGLSDGSVQQFATNGLSKHLAAMTNATIRLAIP